ncbi:MAG: DUF3035 domain-containing protein [Alphaproteobacteria bacterium]|nr:DUF3035 domain-containing protein [Alphaproteobacteria bacterium]
MLKTRFSFMPVWLRNVALSVVAISALSACNGSELRQSMGMERNNPDEFQVVSRPALSVPPVYHLRPPSEDAITTSAADERAQALVFEGKELPFYQRRDGADMQSETAVTAVAENPLSTQAESVLLQNAGAAQANPEIRSILKNEATAYAPTAKKDRSFMDKMKRGWFVADEGDPVVDASKEQQRINENKASDKPLTEGETPVVDPKDKSFLDTLF